MGLPATVSLPHASGTSHLFPFSLPTPDRKGFQLLNLCGYSGPLPGLGCNFKSCPQYLFCPVSAPICTYPQVPEMIVWPQGGASTQSKSNVKSQTSFAAISPARSSRAQCLAHLFPTSSLGAELYEGLAPASAHLIPAIFSFPTALYSH